MAEFVTLENLIKLLDVSSVKVREKVREELASRAEEVERFLQSGEPCGDPDVLFVLDDLVKSHKRTKLRKTWLSWLSVSGDYGQLEAALSYLAKIQPEFTDGAPLTEMLDRMAQSFLESELEPDPLKLNQFLFVEKRLCGAAVDYYHPLNSNLCHTLSEGRGLPISLVCIFMLLGARLGIRIRGVNLPGRFLAKAMVAGRPVLIDCFDRGKILTGREIAAIFPISRFRLRTLLQREPTPTDIVMRVLSNLMNAYQRSGQLETYHLIQELSQDLQGHLIRQNDTLKDDTAQPVKYKRGQTVIHKRYGYRGVIVDFDLTCKADDTWYLANQTQPEKNQPWYHVLVDGSQVTTYPAQSSLTHDPSGKEVRHPLIDKYFEGFHNGFYIRNDVPWALF